MSEETNDNKKLKNTNNKKKIIIVISLIIVLLIGLIIGFIISGNGQKFVEEIQEKIESNNEQTKNRKLNKNKPWVYNGDYLKDREDKKKDGRYQVSKQLFLPVININSEDAKKANNEIAKLYDDLYNEFGSSCGSKYDLETQQLVKNDSAYMITSASYDFYENDNILSVVIKIEKFAVPGDGSVDYVTYNFNLNNLKYATLEDVCKVCKFSSTMDIIEKIRITAENLANIPDTGFDANAEWDNKTFYINRSKVLNVKLPGPVHNEMIEIENDVVRNKQLEI